MSLLKEGERVGECFGGPLHGNRIAWPRVEFFVQLPPVEFTKWYEPMRDEGGFVPKLRKGRYAYCLVPGARPYNGAAPDDTTAVPWVGQWVWMGLEE